VTLSCIIIEDEPLAIEKLEGFIAKTPNLMLKQSFSNSLEGMQFLQAQMVDIVFLDIEMEHLTGIQLLETIDVKPYVIITSAYAGYALKGYELHVFDYLLKPFGFDRFLKAVNKVVDDRQQKNRPANEAPSHFFVKSEYRLENICVNDILYIEGMKEYLRIVLPDRKVLTKMNFKSILEKLPENKFVQVHKSWIVHTDKIESIERNRIKVGQLLIPIGDTYKDNLNKLI
jgi:two-component system, LytTR family, response regulator